MISLCDDWRFRTDGVTQTVRLPHNVRELPSHYAKPEDYEGVYYYDKELFLPDDYRGKRLFLQFDGAAHQAELYVNGKLVCNHRCGYTAFRAEITAFVNLDQPNQIRLRLDSSEDGSIPPFGYVVDYLTYGGLYREAWLDVRDQSYIEDIFVITPSLNVAQVQVTVDGAYDEMKIQLKDGEAVFQSAMCHGEVTLNVPQAKPWSLEEPKLYNMECSLIKAGKVIDRQSATFGFRTAQFKADGFYLNGKKLFLRGLNRHQSYPYIGYAATESLQKEDARILKQELKCNAVRTSHYPQSQHFINACDSLGLLVFTEIPGWQHIGDEAWKAQALENTREMILQYRNHPSIILWGVRINESVDDDAFYRSTNALAHSLDPSRSTSGVRYLEKSHLLENVYAYNDFSHDGTNAGVKSKKSVVKDKNSPLLISEHNGHMFPTKSFDPWEKRQEQALRHAKVLEAAISDGEHVGCFGWCMFDYATHKDFGSGDRICYHGVMDAFRNPKLAAAIYASQGDDEPILEVGCPMDIGDYPAGRIRNIYAFTNADSVALSKNGQHIFEFKCHNGTANFHSPILIDDTIGQLLEAQEGYDPKQAKLIRECLNAAKTSGFANLSTKYKLKLLWCMLRYGLTFEDGVELYGKYVSNWGSGATKWRFDAIKDGKIVKSQIKCPGNVLHIEARASASQLVEAATYDMAAVRIRLLDEYENVASYAQIPIKLATFGAIKLVGPEYVTAEGGMTGCYVQTIGKSGSGRLEISAQGIENICIQFEVIA